MPNFIASLFGGLVNRFENDAEALGINQSSEVVTWLGSTGWDSTSDGDYERINYIFNKQLTQSGVGINGRTALTISTFWACVKMISEDIGKLDINICENDAKGNKQIRNNHPLYKLLSVSPDGQITSQKFRETMVLWCLTWGNGYALTDGRNPANGQISILDLIHPNRVNILVDNGIRTYQVFPSEQDKNKGINGEPFPANQMFHLEGIGDKWSGYPIANFAKECLGITISLQDLQSSMFSNGLNLGGVLKTSQKMEKEHRSAMGQEFGATYGGATNTGKVAVLDNDLSYEQFSVKATDSEVLESRKFQIGEVARFFRVPLHKLGVLDAATMNNMEQENKSYFNDTLSPWIKRYESQIDFKLLPSNRFYVKFDTKPLTMADIKTQMEFWKDAISTAIATPNMAAADLDLPTYDGGDVYYITANNLQPVEQAGLNLEKSKEELTQLKDAPAREDKAAETQAKLLAAAPEPKEEDPAEETKQEADITTSLNNADNIDIFSYRELIEDKLKACITKEAKFCEAKQKDMDKFGESFNAEKYEQKERKFYITQSQYLRDSLIVYFEQTGMPEPKGFIDRWAKWQEVEQWQQLKASYIANDFIANYCGLTEANDGSVFEYEFNGSIVDVKYSNGILECS